MITTNSRVMHMAHSLQKTNPTMTWSDLLKLAWQFQYLRDMLRAGIVKFAYVKGKTQGVPVIRPARGTLHPELIPEDKKPKGSPDYKPNWGTIAYFDLDRQDWRSFRLDALYNIDAYLMLNEVDLSVQNDPKCSKKRKSIQRSRSFEQSEKRKKEAKKEK